MLCVVSVSLGDPARDHETVVRVGGERFRVRRIGTGGDVAGAAAVIRHLDGRVHAIGLGGVDVALGLGRRRWVLPAGRYLAGQARRTPVVDGSGWKAAVEPAAAAALPANGFPLEGRTVLMSSVLDRPWLREALEAAGSRVAVGDAYFALGIPVVFRSVSLFGAAARVLMPFLRLLPLSWMYPLRGPGRPRGPARDAVFRGAEVLAGDAPLLLRRLPADLAGRDVIASTLTADDVALLRAREAGRIATLAPPLGGRWFGANVWEAMAVAALGGGEAGGRPADLLSFWREAGGAPWVDAGGPGRAARRGGRAAADLY